MNKTTRVLITIVFVISLCSLLKFYFGNSYISIAVIVSLGLLSGIASRYFVGYVIPFQILFRYRFIVYGSGFGLMIGLLLLMTKSIKDQIFSIQDLIKWLLIAVPIGTIKIGISSYVKFRKLIKRTINNNGCRDLLCDFAIFTNSEYKTERGLLVLSVNNLSFHKAANSDCLFDIPLLAINPEIKKSKFLNIPNGFSFQDKNYNVNVAYPLYWIKMIDIEKTSTQISVNLKAYTLE